MLPPRHRLINIIKIINLTRISLLLVIISMLSGCCCLWYVAVEEPEVFSGSKMKEKDQTVLNPTTKEKDTKEKSK